MKKVLIAAIPIVIAVLLFLYAIPMIQKERMLSAGKEIKILLVYHPDYLKKAPHILAAYESVLQEEGVPFESLDIYQLISINADEIAKRVPAMVLPDTILQSVPVQFTEWTKEYLSKGGNIAIIYDAGTRHQKGYYLERAAFADIAGINYITYGTTGEKAFDRGHIKFSSEKSCTFFQFPLGKTIDMLTLSGYSYGALEYPIARNESVRDLQEKDIYAYAVTAANEKFPAIVLSDYMQGKVLYVDFPIGHLKTYSDDLPLRAMLRTFLFDVVGIPHIMNVESGRGGVVINWHIDSAVEHKTLPQMQKMGLLRKDITASFDITAGDFRDNPGDGLGFDACGKGRPFVDMMKSFGIIGSHGGWGHNWFARNIENGTFKEKEIRQYIEKNNDCLEKVAGYKIMEYAAPAGVHPQPETTRVLENVGIIAYYYTGDIGSGPNRTFLAGKMVSDKVIAFPVMPFGRTASLAEMNVLDKKKDSEVREWFFDILSYAARNRTIRLVYSHPYDIEYYPGAVKAFIDKVETMQKNKEISVRSMRDYARFLLRFLKTTYTFHAEGNGLKVTLTNPEGLVGITVAIPKARYRPPAEKDDTITEDGKYFYVTISGNDTKQSFLCARN
jgi:hypothetical protein